MKKPDWKRYAPLGRKRSQMMEGGLFMLAVAFLRSVIEILDNYIDARDALFEIVPPVRPIFPHRELIPGAMILPFRFLIQGSFDFYPLFWLFMGLEVISAYLYHRKDTMSIYLMRRLPDPWELHRRCWGMPLILTAGSVLLMGAVLLFCFGIYLVFTPAECLPY